MDFFKKKSIKLQVILIRFYCVVCMLYFFSLFLILFKTNVNFSF